MQLQFPESIPICVGFAIGGGVLEVFATAILAYPASRILQGIVWKDWQLKACLIANILLQISASLFGNLFATWFGPVSVVGPVFFAAQLLANLLIFWVVLGLEAFSHEMQIGTYIIVISVILLIVNGPGTQNYNDQTFEDFMSRIDSILWGITLMVGMIATGVWLLVPALDLHKQPKKWLRFAVLLIARSSAFSLNLTTGKALVLHQSRAWLIANIIVKILSGGIYTRAIVVQSTAVSQKTFVPVNAVAIVCVNALTGIIIWEDWRVVWSWLAYVSVFLLMILGCKLLLGDLGLLQESAPETFLAARPAILRKSERDRMLKNIKNIPRLIDIDNTEFPSAGETSLEGDHDGKTHCSRSRLHSASQRLHISHHSLDSSMITSENGHLPDKSDDEPVEPTSPHHLDQSTGIASQRRVSSRRSLMPRNVNRQAAWAAIYENSRATHQHNCHCQRFHTYPRWTRTTLAICDSSRNISDENPRREIFQRSHSLLGWGSFRRRLVDILEEESELRSIAAQSSSQTNTHMSDTVQRQSTLDQEVG